MDHRGPRPPGEEALLLRAVSGRHAVRANHQQTADGHGVLGRTLRVQQPPGHPQPETAPVQGDGQEETEGLCCAATQARSLQEREGELQVHLIRDSDPSRL